MLTAALERVQLRAAAWAERRQGPDAPTTTLRRRRIYILPTRFGVVFGLLVIAMLLGSLNYNASLGFALTFLLMGLGLVVMHHCHNNLLGTQLRFAGVRPVFAGQRAEFQIGLTNEARVPRYELVLARAGHESRPLDLPAGETAVALLGVPTAQRGWLRLARFSITTRHPANLFRAWSWIHMDAKCLVYPQLAPPGRPLPEETDYETGHGRLRAGDSDFVGLRAAVPGDPPGRLAWKAYARNDELLLKQFAATEQPARFLDWASLPDLGPEQRLAQLARWCVDEAAAGRSFGLNLPGVVLPPGQGERHLHECLTALALFDAGSGGRDRRSETP